MPDPSEQIWAAIPVKAFGQAKSRLSPALSPASRQALAKAMFTDVLTAVNGCDRIKRTVVVTADPEVAVAAQKMGADVLHDQQCAGQTAAVQQAADFLHGQGACAMLTLPGDLPLLTPADVDAICRLLSPSKPLILSPAVNDGGTNALLCRLPTVMRFHFGDDSFAKHLRSANELGLDHCIADIGGFRLDLDRPDDLKDFMASASQTHAYSILRAEQPEHACGG